MRMKMSRQGAVELIGHEGLTLSKYLDSVGVWTIGAGTTRTEIKDLASWPLYKKITIKEAVEYFEKSLPYYENALNDALTKEVPQHVFDALVSWAYNVGIGWIKKGSLIRYVNEGRSNKELHKKIMEYTSAGGKELKGLINRRRKEARLLTEGKYSNKGKALLYKVNSKGKKYGGKLVNVYDLLEESEEEEVEDDKKDIHVVIDFSKPSYEKRLFVYDKDDKLLRSHHVAHGVNSSDPKNRAMAVSFSNKPGSHKSSLGKYKTAETYYGKHGYSLKLDGLEKGINDNARKRYIVIHPADYVTDSFIAKNGRAGQSHGCPAIDPAISKSLIDMIKEGVDLEIIN